MRAMAVFASSVILLGSFSGRLGAQDSPCVTRTILVTVIDQQGNPVRGLTAANFRGKFRGKPVQIDSATFDTGHRRVVIVLDASGSMRGEQVGWELVSSVAADIFRNAPASNSIALIVFSDTIRERVGFVQNTVELAKKLAALPRTPRIGKTSLYDALAAALLELTPPVLGDAIFAITDGGDNASKTKPASLETAHVGAGVRFFAFVPLPGFAPRLRTPEEARGPSVLLSFAEATGGNVYMYVSSRAPFDPSEEERKYIRAATAQLARQIWQYDRLEIRLPAPVDKPRGWKLEVLDENGKPNSRLKALYPHQLTPCQ